MRTLTANETLATSGGDAGPADLEVYAGTHLQGSLNAIVCTLNDASDCRSAILASSSFLGAAGAAAGAAICGPICALVGLVIGATTGGAIAAEGNPSCQCSTGGGGDGGDGGTGGGD